MCLTRLGVAEFPVSEEEQQAAKLAWRPVGRSWCLDLGAELPALVTACRLQLARAVFGRSRVAASVVAYG